jgi:hypothetical protein
MLRELMRVLSLTLDPRKRLQLDREAAQAARTTRPSTLSLNPTCTQLEPNQSPTRAQPEPNSSPARAQLEPNLHPTRPQHRALLRTRHRTHRTLHHHQPTTRDAKSRSRRRLARDMRSATRPPPRDSLSRRTRTQLVSRTRNHPTPARARPSRPRDARHNTPRERETAPDPRDRATAPRRRKGATRKTCNRS